MGNSEEVIKRLVRIVEYKNPGHRCAVWLTDYEYYTMYEIYKPIPYGREIIKSIKLPYPRSRGVVNRLSDYKNK